MTDKPKIADGKKPIVYVREASPAALPDHMKSIPGKVFAVHDLEGNCLALTQDRNVAFALARQNDMKPVSVH